MDNSSFRIWREWQSSFWKYCLFHIASMDQIIDWNLCQNIFQSSNHFKVTEFIFIWKLDLVDKYRCPGMLSDRRQPEIWFYLKLAKYYFGFMISFSNEFRFPSKVLNFINKYCVRCWRLHLKTITKNKTITNRVIIILQTLILTLYSLNTQD